MTKHRVAVGLAAALATSASIATLPAADAAPARPHTTSVAQVLATDGHRFDKSWGDFDILDKAVSRGVPKQTIDTLRHAGVDLEHWLVGFEKVEDGVRSSVEVIRNHPLLPKDIRVHGMLIHPETGKLDVVTRG